jgi:hypothetical protein
VIPLLAKVGVRSQRGSGFRLWIPLFLVWLVLLPIVLLLLPLMFVLWWALQVNPFRALSACWQVLSGLRRTHVEVEHEHRSMLIHII